LADHFGAPSSASAISVAFLLAQIIRSNSGGPGDWLILKALFGKETGHHPRKHQGPMTGLLLATGFLRLRIAAEGGAGAADGPYLEVVRAE
jgi:hypothetical protein